MIDNTEIRGEINALKQLLTNTDYQAIKFAENEISKEDFTPIREKRAAWRMRINELEAQLIYEEIKEQYQQGIYNAEVVADAVKKGILTVATGDLQMYLTQLIEAEVNRRK